MTLRPAIRPGSVLLRRDAHHLQIGTSPGYVLRDQPGLFSVIRLLDGSRTTTRIGQIVSERIPEFSGDVSLVVHELMAAGLAFDARWWDFPSDPHIQHEARSASLRGTSPVHIGERTHFRVCLKADTACEELAAITTAVLTRSGFERPGGPDPHLRVLLSHGEPSREQLASAMDAGHDHLRVVVEEDRVRIGPLVRPGLTPCTNCHDLHRTDWDRAWPALMTQFGKASGATSAPALNATTLYAAATAIAAEVTAHCQETPGDTTGHCLVIGPHHLDRAVWPVTFHPACSCTLLIAA